MPRTNGHARPESTFKVRTARPIVVAEAAILADRMVCGLIGNGESTIASRRSGNVLSQVMTAMSPTTSIVVDMRRCSVCQARAWRVSGVVGDHVEINAAK